MLYGHCLVASPCKINETLKWLTYIAAHLNAEVMLVVTAGVAFDISSLSFPTSSDFGPRLYHERGLLIH